MLLLLQQIEGSSLFKSKLLRKFASFEFHIATGFLYNFWWVSKLFSSIYSKLIQIVVTTKCNSMYDRFWFFVQLFFPGKNRKRLNCYIKVLLQKSWQWKYACENGTGPSPQYLLFRELNEITSMIFSCPCCYASD